MLAFTEFCVNDQKKTRGAKEPTDSEKARHLQQNRKVKIEKIILFYTIFNQTQ